jgi:hypothetical protein
MRLQEQVLTLPCSLSLCPLLPWAQSGLSVENRGGARGRRRIGVGKSRGKGVLVVMVLVAAARTGETALTPGSPSTTPSPLPSRRSGWLSVTCARLPLRLHCSPCSLSASSSPSPCPCKSRRPPPTSATAHASPPTAPSSRSCLPSILPIRVLHVRGNSAWTRSCMAAKELG